MLMQKNFRNNTGTPCCGKQWTHGALNIFELSICKYDHFNNTRCSILRVPLIFINVRHLIYLYIYKFYNYIHGKYIWNRSVMLTHNACFMKRNIGVKHMTRMESLRNKKTLWLQHQCAFEGWSMFKVMKPSMWPLDDNYWEAGQQQIVN